MSDPIDELFDSALEILHRLSIPGRLRIHLSSATWGNAQKCDVFDLHWLMQNGYIVQENGPPEGPFGWARLTDKARAALVSPTPPPKAR